MTKRHARGTGIGHKASDVPTPDLFTHDLARGLYVAACRDVDDTFKDFYRELMESIPGNKSLERASAIFQMNEAKLVARHRALVSAAEIELEERKIQLQKDLDIMEMQGKAGTPVAGTN